MDLRSETLRARPATGLVNTQTVLVANLFVCLICALPVFVVQNLPLHDWPFHLARMVVLTQWDMSEYLQKFYNVGTFILPNIGMDAVVVALAHIMPVELAARVFVAATIVLQITGCAALYRSLYGRFSLSTLASALFVFNWIFLYAFLNYLFGVGLLLWAMAAWVMVSRRSATQRLIVGSICATLLFFCHLIACGLFAVMVAAHELYVVWQQRPAPRDAFRRLIVGALPFLIPALLFLVSPTSEGSHLTSHRLVNLLRLPPIAVRVLLSGNWLVDGLLILLVIAIAISLYLNARIRMPRPMLAVLFALCATYVVMPHELMGGWGADTRIPVVIAFFICGATKVSFRRPRQATVMMAVMMTFVVWRTALMVGEWRTYDRLYGAMRETFRAIPAGSVLYAASEYPFPSMQDIDLRLWQPPLAQAASLAVAVNPAIFVTMNWATKGQQPITPTAKYAPLYNLQAQHLPEIHNTTELAKLAEGLKIVAGTSGVTQPIYILLTYPERYHIALPPEVTSVGGGDRFSLLKIK